MCGSSKSRPAEKPTPPPTTNLVAVEPTEGTVGQRRSRVLRQQRMARPQRGATMLTQEGL